MSARPRKTFDIRFEYLSRPYVDDVASLHLTCFPKKVESLLGCACVRDLLLDRMLGPERDTLCVIAVHQADNRLAGYACVSDLVAQSSSLHAFINKRVLKRHMLRSGWARPSVWMWWLNRMTNRFRRVDHSEGSVVPIPPAGGVVKIVGIHPEFRGGNVGVDLMMRVETEARSRGLRELHLLVEQSNIKAERLYASTGWVRTSPETGRWQLFCMKKIL